MTGGPLEECLSYRDRIPVALRPASAAGVPGGWAEQNLRVLSAIATLDERPRFDPDSENAAEFDRLHHKFDVMIELLGALLRSQRLLPEAQSVRLSCEGLSLPLPASPPPVGSLMEVELHLHSCAPSPWLWYGEVLAHHDGELYLRFVPMSPGLAAAMERHVFTRHRRSVANARSPARRPDSGDAS